MYQIRENDKKSGWKKSKSQDTSQAKELQMMINRELSVAEGDRWKDWNNIIRALRVMPVLQVMRKIYSILKPWVNYGQDSKWKQDNYRLNVDMLFEELIKTANMDSLSINWRMQHLLFFPLSAIHEKVLIALVIATYKIRVSSLIRSLFSMLSSK